MNRGGADRRARALVVAGKTVRPAGTVHPRNGPREEPEAAEAGDVGHEPCVVAMVVMAQRLRRVAAQNTRLEGAELARLDLDAECLGS